VRLLHERGHRIHATEGTAAFLRSHKIPCTVAKKDRDTRHSAESLVRARTVDLVLNIPEDPFERRKSDGFFLRRAAVDMNIPLITNRQLAEAFVFALSESAR
jgi:carbamoyl-phosphate synthase large subunit